MLLTEIQKRRLINKGFTVNHDSAIFTVGFGMFIDVVKLSCHLFEYAFIDGSSYIPKNTSSLNKIIKFKENISKKHEGFE